LHLHIGNFVSNRFEFAYSLSELLTGGSIPDTLLQKAIHRANVTCKETNSFPIHRVGENGCTTAHTRNDRIASYQDVLENEFTERRSAQAHLLELLARSKTA